MEEVLQFTSVPFTVAMRIELCAELRVELCPTFFPPTSQQQQTQTPSTMYVCMYVCMYMHASSDRSHTCVAQQLNSEQVTALDSTESWTTTLHSSGSRTTTLHSSGSRTTTLHSSGSRKSGVVTQAVKLSSTQVRGSKKERGRYPEKRHHGHQRPVVDLEWKGGGWVERGVGRGGGERVQVVVCAPHSTPTPLPLVVAVGVCVGSGSGRQVLGQAAGSRLVAPLAHQESTVTISERQDANWGETTTTH